MSTVLRVVWHHQPSFFFFFFLGGGGGGGGGEGRGRGKKSGLGALASTTCDARTLSQK